MSAHARMAGWAPSSWLSPFVSADRQLRNGWWVAIFLIVLASLLVPVLAVTRRHGTEVSIIQQAGIISVASWVCQLLRRKPLVELTGRIDLRWLKEVLAGGLLGSALMLLPALVLLAGGWVAWRVDSVAVSALLPSLALFDGPSTLPPKQAH